MKEFPNTESTERVSTTPTDYPMVFLDPSGVSNLTNKPFSRYMFVPTILRGIDLISSGESQRVNDTKTLIGTEEYLQKRASQLARLNNINVVIQIAGNSKHKVGDLCTLAITNMPNYTGNAQQAETKMKYYSGNYLITAIKHIVTYTEYTMIIELSKDSTLEKIGKI